MEPCGTEALMGEASDDWPFILNIIRLGHENIDESDENYKIVKFCAQNEWRSRSCQHLLHNLIIVL